MEIGGTEGRWRRWLKKLDLNFAMFGNVRFCNFGSACTHTILFRFELYFTFHYTFKGFDACNFAGQRTPSASPQTPFSTSNSSLLPFDAWKFEHLFSGKKEVWLTALRSPFHDCCLTVFLRPRSFSTLFLLELIFPLKLAYSPHSSLSTSSSACSWGVTSRLSSLAEFSSLHQTACHFNLTLPCLCPLDSRDHFFLFEQ